MTSSQILLYIKLSSIFQQICGNDPLPKKICIQCEQDVNIFYMKIKRFRALDKKWRDDIRSTNPTHPFLNIQQHYDVCICLLNVDCQ